MLISARQVTIFLFLLFSSADQASVVSALFNYWATHMLPERSWEGSRGPCLLGAGAPQEAAGSPGDPAGHREDGAP